MMPQWLKAGLLTVLWLFLPLSARAGDETREYTYRFESPRFDITFSEIKVMANGEGQLRYKKRDEDEEILIKMKLLPATVGRLGELFETLRFLDSNESYQTDKQFPHLGTITLGLRAQGRAREVHFNYTENRTASQLVELFRAIENQQRRYEDMTLARRHTPLDLPRQLKNLEAELKKDRLAEPSQFLPLLKEITLDDSLPLIARNAADRLAKQIEHTRAKH
ncbi:MAG: hypothetical protein AB1489_19765 [Acidobacteriota bacterium]